MWTRARAVALGLAGMTLAACGGIHPGDAAVVDGHSISMKTFDDTAKIYCTLTARSAAQQGVTAVDNADIRRQAITDLVTVVVARDVAAFKGVTPKPRAFELTPSQQQQITEAFPSNGDEVGAVIEDSQEISAIAIGLGEQSTGQTRTPENEADLAQIGQAAILKAFSDHDVRFAPRFGLSDSMKQLSPTGSLSVAEVDLEKPAGGELPAAQRCV